jgi:8-oxo-dGTP pyrophosphatase MutT (NUDIX family)
MTPLKQVAAIPYVDTADGRLVLMITTRGFGRWSIPKGWPKPGLADHETAAREAFEEAGIKGDVGAEPIGAFHYTKRLHLLSWARCSVDVYPLHARCQHLSWPEQQSRRTLWVAPEKAASMVRTPQLAEVLRGIASGGRLALLPATGCVEAVCTGAHEAGTDSSRVL